MPYHQNVVTIAGAVSGDSGLPVPVEEPYYYLPLSLGVQLKLPVSRLLSFGVGVDYSYLVSRYASLVNGVLYNDTYSQLHYADDVSSEVKQQRLDRLMALQQRISAEVEAAKVGTTMKVIIDRREGDYYIGRTEYCSPEVDPEVLIPAAARRLRTGSFYNVKITDAEEFDLYGEVV